MSHTRIPVTGGAGFIGSPCVRTLLGPDGPDDVTVTVPDAFTYPADPADVDPVQDSPRYRLCVGDDCERAVVDTLMAEHDQVVRFAAEFVPTDVLGTQVLLDAALRHGVERFVHISTDEVHGSIPEGSTSEEHPLHPDSHRKGHDRRYSVDWSEARAELGYEPQKDFTEGLAETVARYRDNPQVREAAARRAALPEPRPGAVPC